MLRDPTIAESAKQRSLRVPLEYARRADRLGRRKLMLGAVAGFVGLSYVLWLLVGGRMAKQQLSPGPLARAHASFGDDCQACHRAFQPLRADSVGLFAALSTSAKRREATDAACIHCHKTPHHHALASADDELSCAACHREHQGPTAEIARANDANCVRCHHDLSRFAVAGTGASAAYANVTGFAGADAGRPPHPDFRSLQAGDPGNIKFNHWLHLQPGVAPRDGKNKLHVADLLAADQPRYGRNAAADGLVQLDCASCHEPGDDGRLMRPIAYEQHCRACHPLAVSIDDQGPVDVPHGMPAERLQAVLDGLLFNRQRQEAPVPAPSADESGDLPLIPGRTLGNSLAQKIQSDVLGQRGTLAAAVNAKCLQCHEGGQPAGDEELQLPTLLAANIPNPWLAHARFDHRAHRHVDCRQCHAESFAFEKRDAPRFVNAGDGARAARDNEEVMIAGIEVCANCHAPQRGKTGGARQDCAECHAYHGREETREFQAGPGRRTGSELQVDGFRAALGPAQRSGPTLRLAAFAQSVTAVGAATCSSANCHGNADLAAPAWKSAFTTWAMRDPHAQAYNVLFTQRSVEMTRRLAGQAEALAAKEHRQMLKERCLDCHGDGDSGMAGSNLGVGCEACHGPAEQWLHKHDRRDFRRDTAGFVDMKDLTVRAQTCLECHSRYPAAKSGGEPRHAVDHELIAAGHPRLAFELDSYLESLPAHWDRRTDAARHEPAFHFRTWLAGQEEDRVRQTARKRGEQPPDFAELDCFACHHALAAGDRLVAPRLAALDRVKWPPANLLAIENSADLRARASLVSRFLEAAGKEGRWDAAVGGLASAQAFGRDLDPTDAAPLIGPLARLRSYLASDSFTTVLRSGRAPTIYDSPSEFEPQQVQPRVDEVLRPLRRIESRAGPASRE